MRSPHLWIVLAGLALMVQASSRGLHLSERTWIDAERTLGPDSVIVLPIGAGLQQHGPHLPLRTDLAIAEHLGQRLAGTSSVVIVPALAYHLSTLSPDYPGSVSLGADTARDVVGGIARSLAMSGPRRFYAIPVGAGTETAVNAAAQQLAREGILLGSLPYDRELQRLSRPWAQQTGGGHADELETSLMLHIDAGAVDMKLAVREFAPWTGPLTRSRTTSGTYSASGVWGDPTVASREKGQYLSEGLTAAMARDVETLRTASLPSARRTAGSSPPRPVPPRAVGPTRVFECTGGVERDIKRVEAAYNTHWVNRDADQFAALWADQGDLVHPDGLNERTRQTIRDYRREQFKSAEFKSAAHSLVFGIIRCLNETTAVVDARWSLRDVTDSSGATLPNSEGQATLVLQRAGDDWPIEAYRYHVKPGTPPAPVWQKRPGLPDRR